MASKSLYSHELNGIYNVIEALNDQPWPTRTSYKLGKLQRSIAPHVEDFEKERNKIVKKHAEKDDEGNFKHPKDEEGKELKDQLQIKDLQELNKEIFEIGNEQIEVVLPVKLTIDDLDYPDCQVKIEQMRVLATIIEEPEEDEEGSKDEN